MKQVVYRGNYKIAVIKTFTLSPYDRLRTNDVFDYAGERFLIIQVMEVDFSDYEKVRVLALVAKLG